ncbi:MAG: exopolysaccharide biosynthesis protein [Stanieria sp.]
MAKLSLELNRYFFEEERQSEVTLAELLDLAGERIFGFLLVILSFPSALPIPAPGYSIPFGILMFILALQLISGRQRPWLPAKMMKGSMKLETVQGVLQKGIPWLQKIEALSKPRLSYICTGLTGRIIMGIAIALMSISMMIPIPGTNTLPAMGIWVTGFGLMEDDGLICLAGLLLSAVAGTLSTSIIIAVIWGGSSLLDVIKGWLAS